MASDTLIPASANRSGLEDRHDIASGTVEGRRKPSIEELKARDNRTNILNLAHVWLVIAATAAATLYSFHLVAEAGLGWWWNIPAAAAAILLIGASQHQLGGAIHEACHYLLFKNRVASEAVSDWCAAFPIYTTTHAFRLHHLAHHQFVNDPERDPNFDQAKDSGHWLDFPIAHVDFLVAVVKQLNPILLFRYIMARLRYSAIGVETNPYSMPGQMGSPWVVRAAILFGVLSPFASVFIPLGHPEVTLAIIAGAWLATVVFYVRVPDEAFQKNRVNPVISRRSTQIGFVTLLGIVYSALTVAEVVTGTPAWGYYFLLWVVPLFTSFPLFMILREWLQHGNADRGRYTNSRVFLVNPLLRYAVFPWGMDYHLPHHLVASVPHYKLRDLHEYLLDDPKYAAQCTMVEGWSQHGEHGLPTMIDVLGPGYTPQGNPVHVDDATLELADVGDRDGIAAHAEASRKG